MNGSQQSLPLLKQNLQHTKIFRLEKTTTTGSSYENRTQKTELL